jgi:hypothetical protein
MSLAEKHPSDLRDHVLALAAIVHPYMGKLGKQPGQPYQKSQWFMEIAEKYHVEIEEGQDWYSLTVEQIYALWSGLLGTESDRFAADTTLSDALKAKGERY